MASIAPLHKPAAKKSNRSTDDLLAENTKLKQQVASLKLEAENAKLKQQVASLKNEVADLKSQLKKRKADDSSSFTDAVADAATSCKKAKTPIQRKGLFEKSTDAVADAVATPAVATAAAASSKLAKTPNQRKRLFEKWARAAARESSKCWLAPFDAQVGYDVTVAETLNWTPHDFEAMFGHSNGTKIQPTPEQKPRSLTTILKYNNYEEIKELFGDAKIPKTGYIARAIKMRNVERCCDWNGILNELEVHYNKSKLTLQLKFKFITGDWYM